MDLPTAIEILEKHNEWRRDENIPPKTDMQNPTDLGNAIDYALIELKKLRVGNVIKNGVAVCDVCGSNDITEASHMGRNCNSSNTL